MKVALFESTGQLRVTTKGLRALRDDEVLLKVSACGVCGTDVHIVGGESRATPPVVLGHEYFGVVEDVKGGGAPERGMRGAVDPNISCGTCFYCRKGLGHLCSDLKALGVDIDGGMAEWCIVPVRQIHALPSDMKADTGVFVEPVSCAVHGIDRAGIRSGDSVVIIGGGTIGLIMVQLAQAAGAANTILLEPVGHKRKIAAKLGVTAVLDPSEQEPVAAVLDITGVGADIVIECAGKQETALLALRLVRKGGTVEFFGVSPRGATISVEPYQIFSRELRIVGSFVNPQTFDRAIEMLRSGVVRVDSFPVHRFPLDAVHEALRHQREGLTIKSIVEPNS